MARAVEEAVHPEPMDIDISTGQMPGSLNLSRSMDPSEQLDVDLTILEYLLYKATGSLIRRRKVELRQEDLKGEDFSDGELEMTNSWLGFILQRHGSSALPFWHHYRSLLLQLVSLFTLRLRQHPPITTPASIYELRNRVHLTPHQLAQSSSLIDNHDPPFDEVSVFPLSHSELHTNRLTIGHTLSILRTPSDPELEQWSKSHYGTSSCASLADLLPLFIELTRTRAQVGSFSVNRKWLMLAGEWMLQAALEAYLVYGAYGTEAAVEVFAWGSDATTAPQLIVIDDDDDDDDGKDTLEGQTGEKATVTPFNGLELDPSLPANAWDEIRAEYLDVLLGTKEDENRSAKHIMEEASQQFSIADFEGKVLGLLEALAKELPTPDLVQVEQGKIEGVDEEESEAMFERMGLRVRR